MNNKSYKKLLDDRIKAIPRNIFTKNIINEYTIIQDNISDDNKQINSQKDLLIKLDETVNKSKNVMDKYNNIIEDRKKDDNLIFFDNKNTEINSDYNRYRNILEEQKKKTQELIERLNIK